jgi:putative transposase
MRYVERNALRANFVEQAEQWRWSSLWRRTFGTEEQKLLLSEWPLPVPSRWRAHVNAAQTESEVQAVRDAILRGCPFGSPQWQKRTAGRLGLEWTLRARGRPRTDQQTAAE